MTGLSLLQSIYMDPLVQGFIVFTGSFTLFCGLICLLSIPIILCRSFFNNITATISNYIEIQERQAKAQENLFKLLSNAKDSTTTLKDSFQTLLKTIFGADFSYPSLISLVACLLRKPSNSPYEVSNLPSFPRTQQSPIIPEYLSNSNNTASKQTPPAPQIHQIHQLPSTPQIHQLPPTDSYNCNSNSGVSRGFHRLETPQTRQVPQVLYQQKFDPLSQQYQPNFVNRNIENIALEEMKQLSQKAASETKVNENLTLEQMRNISEITTKPSKPPKENPSTCPFLCSNSANCIDISSCPFFCSLVSCSGCDATTVCNKNKCSGNGNGNGNGNKNRNRNRNGNANKKPCKRKPKQNNRNESIPTKVAFQIIPFTNSFPQTQNDQFPAQQVFDFITGNQPLNPQFTQSTQNFTNSNGGNSTFSQTKTTTLPQPTPNISTSTIQLNDKVESLKNALSNTSLSTEYLIKSLGSFLFRSCKNNQNQQKTIPSLEEDPQKYLNQFFQTTFSFCNNDVNQLFVLTSFIWKRVFVGLLAQNNTKPEFMEKFISFLTENMSNFLRENNLLSPESVESVVQLYFEMNDFVNNIYLSQRGNVQGNVQKEKEQGEKPSGIRKLRLPKGSQCESKNEDSLKEIENLNAIFSGRFSPPYFSVNTIPIQNTNPINPSNLQSNNNNYSNVPTQNTRESTLPKKVKTDQQTPQQTPQSQQTNSTSPYNTFCAPNPFFNPVSFGNGTYQGAPSNPSFNPNQSTFTVMRQVKSPQVTIPTSQSVSATETVDQKKQNAPEIPLPNDNLNNTAIQNTNDPSESVELVDYVEIVDEE